MSGTNFAAAAWSLFFLAPATTWSSPSIRAAKPCAATCAGSSLSAAPTLVSSMSARSKKLVSVGPGIKEVTVTPVSLSSLRIASAKDCTKAFDAL